MPKPDSSPGPAAGVDLKTRIQGFGNGPAFEPEPETLWGALFGASPETEKSINDSISNWYVEAVKGFEDVVNEIAEEVLGEPVPQANLEDTPTNFPGQQPNRDNEGNLVTPGPAPKVQEDASHIPGFSLVRTTSETDAPGRYRIIAKEAFMTGTLLLGGNVKDKLYHGAEVIVEEVVDCHENNRLRGRLQSPVGWISLQNTHTGYRWAERISDAGAGSKVGCGDRLAKEANDSVFGAGAEERLAKSCKAEDEELKVGDLVVRKNREATIISIDRCVNPPAYTVRMHDDGREVGSEQHLLKKMVAGKFPINCKVEVLRSSGTWSAGTVVAVRPDQLTVLLEAVDWDGHQLQKVYPSALVPAQVRLPEAASAPSCPQSSSSAASKVAVDVAPEVDLLDMGSNEPQTITTLPLAETTLQDRLAELEALKKEAVMREDFIGAQQFKSEIEALLSKEASLKEQAASSSSAALKDQKDILSLDAPNEQPASSTSPSVSLAPPPPSSVPLLQASAPGHRSRTAPMPNLLPIDEDADDPAMAEAFADFPEPTSSTAPCSTAIPGASHAAPFDPPLAAGVFEAASFDPLAPAELSSCSVASGYPATSSDWRGTAVPRGISLFDPMSDSFGA